MSVINTNVKALFSQAALHSTERAQAKAMAQLSTGKRINSAGDDAAGSTYDDPDQQPLGSKPQWSDVRPARRGDVVPAVGDDIDAAARFHGDADHILV